MLRALGLVIVATMLKIVPCSAMEGPQGLFFPIAQKERTEQSGKRTFVFWVNGDSDHFQSGRAYSDSDAGKLFRVDQYDVEKIRGYALSCRDCNVVILHHQRGGARWYTSDSGWATYLRVYEAGNLIAERHIPFGNAADPAYLAGLLRFSEDLFPGQPTYLIYRGHSFFPAYDPKTNADQIMPFAFGFPESPYGIRNFEESLRLARLQHPLEAVIFAACSMARLEVAGAVAPYSRRLIASQVDILETLSSGFLFSFLINSSQFSTEEEFARFAGSSLMGNIDLVSYIPRGSDEAMMEYPTTLMNLTGFDSRSADWGVVRRTLQEMDPDSVHAQAGVERVISDRYAETLSSGGLSKEKIDLRSQFVRMPSLDPKEVDSLQVLRLIANAPATSGSEGAKSAQRLIEDLTGRIHLFKSSRYSKKSGLSMELP